MELNTQIFRPSTASSSLVPSREWPAPGDGYPGGQDYGIDGDVRFATVVRRHARLILIVMGSCIALGLLVTFLIKPSYKARTVLEVLAVNGDFMNNKDVDPNVTASAADSYVETQTKLLTSETVADRVVAAMKPKMTESTVVDEGGFGKLRRWLGLQPAVSDAPEILVRRALAHLKVKVEGQSSLISLTVLGPTPRLAADIANAVTEQHIAALQDARWSTATRTAEFLSAQLDAQRKNLQASENELQNYTRSTGLIYTSETANESVAAEKLREVQADLEKAEADRADKQSQLELIHSSPIDSLPRILDDGTVRENKSRLTDLRRQLADLSATLTPSHYKVREVQSQIAALEKQQEQERSFIVRRIENDYRAALRREEIQKSAYRQQLDLVTNQSAKQVRYNILKREVDTNRDLYQSMLQKIKEASVVAALRASNIRVVDPARPPRTPYQPNLPLNMAISLLAGSMLSIVLVLLRERGDRTIRTPGESTRLLQVPELAIIPSARRDVRTQIVAASTDRRIRIRRSPSRALPGPASESSQDVISSWLHTASLVAESFRSAVASLLFWGRDKARDNRVLVMTSAHPGAGKTTSVINLGIGLVESGRRVLLVDGDLRLPRLGKIFGLEGASGMSDILRDQLTPSVAKELIRDTGLKGLEILPSGPRLHNVTQMLHSKALKRLIDSIRGEYDFILIDSPPAIPLADSRLLAEAADGVILVVRAGQSSAGQLLSVRKCFQQDGTHVFGSILNDWDARSEDPSYVNSYVHYAQSAGA